MGYDRYTLLPVDCSCRNYLCSFRLELANTFSWPFVPILSNFCELKTTNNAFQDCRVHFFRQPFSKQLYAAALVTAADIDHCSAANLTWILDSNLQWDSGFLELQIPKPRIPDSLLSKIFPASGIRIPLHRASFEYTAISRKVVGKNVNATIPKGNMGYDRYTLLPVDCSCRNYLCSFRLELANTFSWPFVPILSNFCELKTTNNAFQDCRVHFFRQPFSKQLYAAALVTAADIDHCSAANLTQLY